MASPYVLYGLFFIIGALAMACVKVTTYEVQKEKVEEMKVTVLATAEREEEYKIRIEQLKNNISGLGKELKKKKAKK